jgi:hypothetical protein
MRAPLAAEYDSLVMLMNEARRPASGWVQRPPPNVAAEVAEPGHPTFALAIAFEKEDISMLKTISAALLAVSVLAAPAFAAASRQSAPVVKTGAAKAGVKTGVLNAQAKMGRHHVSHHRHHPHHGKIGALSKHHISKVAIKHAAAVKRG